MQNRQGKRSSSPLGSNCGSGHHCSICGSPATSRTTDLEYFLGQCDSCFLREVHEAQMLHRMHNSDAGDIDDCDGGAL